MSSVPFAQGEFQQKLIFNFTLLLNFLEEALNGSGSAAAEEALGATWDDIMTMQFTGGELKQMATYYKNELRQMIAGEDLFTIPAENFDYTTPEKQKVPKREGMTDSTV